MPHGGEATRQDLTLLGERMARQIDELRQRTGQPVDIVAESEGTLVTRAYLAGHDDPPVGRVMLLSPIEVTGRVSYPEPGEDGAGYAGGSLLRRLGEVIEIVSPFDGSIDGPLARSIQLLAEDRADAFAGLDAVMVVPFADALSAPLPPRSRFSTEVVPAFHGGLRGRGDVKTMITTWLGGERPEGSAAVRFIAGLVSDSFAAWRVPDMGTDDRL
jgi:hypothetical protein